jgi:bacteriocin biosynthesis cyclodehydratase domain-containing protein
MADLRRPRLALPFTVLVSPGVVRLVAGEDFRYTLQADGLDRWLPGLLASLDGRRRLDEALGGIGDADRRAAAEIVERLYGERVLVDGGAAEAHPAALHRLVAEGRGPLIDGLATGPTSGPALTILCQDRLDYDETLRFNRARLEGAGPWMWATIGPMARGYVSPVFLPGSGPCLGCLLGQFRRRSPAPELYDALEEQGRNGRPIEPSTFPAEGVGILRNLILRKAAMLSDPGMPAAPYRLHVLEAATLEVSSHSVYRDPECEACGSRRR